MIKTTFTSAPNHIIANLVERIFFFGGHLKQHIVNYMKVVIKLYNCEIIQISGKLTLMFRPTHVVTVVSSLLEVKI